VFFRFTVPIIAVHLQNANVKFHKVVYEVYRHYSYNAENVYITVWQIHPGQYTQNFIRIGWFSWKI